MGQAFLFPGQGSQISGMGGAALAAFPELVAAADRILGYSVRELCASEERLDQTEGVGKYFHLSVSVAAHSRYMVPAAREFRELLAGVWFAEPAVPVIANVTGQPHTRSTMVDLLSQHLCCPVRWWDTLCLLATEGVDQVVELGPGEVLQKMWHRERSQLPPRARRPGASPGRRRVVTGASRSRRPDRTGPGSIRQAGLVWTQRRTAKGLGTRRWEPRASTTRSATPTRRPINTCPH